MPELNENDLRKLFQVAGHQAPTRDLTDRIMARVAVTPIIRLSIVQPLISKRAWIISGLCLIGLVLLITFFPSGADQPASPVSNLVTAAYGTISEIRLPKGSWPIWTSMAAGSLLLFMWIDGTFMRRLRSAS